MATIADLAREDAEVLCAMDAFTQPTPRVMDHGFDLLTAVAETHIPTGGTAVDNTADEWTPHADFTDFWLPSVPATERFSNV